MTDDIIEVVKKFNIEQPEIGQPEIIENGKNVMRPEIMNFLMTATLASQAVRIRKYFDDRTSEGYTQNFALNVTPVPQEVIPDHIAQTLFIINDGAGQIFVTINGRGRTPTPLLITETMFFDFETHKLENFYVWSAAGTVATARALVRW